jgi:RND family efflux transporter MFP subunit
MAIGKVGLYVLAAMKSRSVGSVHRAGAFCLALALLGCAEETVAAEGGGMPPPRVAVLELSAAPVVVHDAYVARVAAPETIEIRPQVTGIVTEQAFEDGARVEAGDVLYTIDARPFAAVVQEAEASLAEARAQAQNARTVRARAATLSEREVVSRAEFESADAGSAAAEALVAAREASLRDARLNLAYCRIRAPEAGVVTRSLVRPGSLVTAQSTLLSTLYAGDSLQVYFAVDQDDVPIVTGPQAGAEREFEIVLDDGSIHPTRGTLDFLAPAVDDTTGTVEVRIEIAGADDRLRPGQMVRVRVPILERSDGIRVPQRAVAELQGLKSVFVVNADGTVSARSIRARHRLDGDWLVDEGLTAGETIVVEGTDKVRDGMPVATVPFEAAPERG